MQITKTSPVTGQSNTREIDVTEQQLIDWRNGALIQTVMPSLSKEDREFIMTGTTPEDWETMFADEEEE
jgi:Na+-transporting NADH:ubiquinone oxidoreductase subunit NqrF